jgi:hypothetical protein
MKIKTAEATGPALDWLVAKCEGYEAATIKNNGPVHLFRTIGYDPMSFQPSTNWAQGGPIIEREEIDIAYCNPAAGWSATGFRNTKFGPTPLLAAMRCYCASKLGDEVDVPEELK